MTAVSPERAPRPARPTWRAKAARAVYEARYRAHGLAPVPWEELSVDEREMWWGITKAGIDVALAAMTEVDRTAVVLRSMISAKQLVIADAGISRGLAPDWQPATFTAGEILAAIGDEEAECSA